MPGNGLLEPAYILHSRNYRDTSLILDVMGRETGRCAMVVKGARSARSKTRGRLQPFTPLLVAAMGRGELKTLTAVDFPVQPCRLSGRSLLLGLYVNELLYRLLGRFDPAPALYDYYEDLLVGLRQVEIPEDVVRRFELNLLRELGYGIDFESDARTGRPVQPAARYRYLPREGFHETADDVEDVYPGEELLHLAAGELHLADRRRLRDLTRRSLAELLGDRPLRSRRLFKGLAE